jgi:hypothetical protein
MNYRERKIIEYMSRGYATVPWGHHPKAIRDELRRMGLRPMLKSCFRNCQAFALRTELPVEYREGWVLSLGVPLEHAWLNYEGKIVDLTIYDQTGIKHLGSVSCSKREILLAMASHNCYGIVKRREVHDLMFPRGVSAMLAGAP